MLCAFSGEDRPKSCIFALTRCFFVLRRFTIYIWMVIIGITGVFARNKMSGYLQNPIDSMVRVIERSNESDSLKIKKINRILSAERYARGTYALIRLAEEIAQKSRNKILIADSYRSYGIYYFYNSQLDSAIYYLSKVKETVSGEEAPFITASATTGLGGAYKRKGNITRAVSHFLEAKDILSRIDTLQLSSKQKKQLLTQRMSLYNSIANFYNSIDDYQQATENYEHAYRYALLLHEPKFAGAILSNKGDLLLKMNRYADALKVLLQSKALKVKGQGPAASLAYSNQNIALAQLHLKMYRDALSNVNKALNYYVDSKMVSGQVQARLIRGQIRLITGKYKTSINDLEISQSMASKIGMLEEQKNACLYLSEAYEAIGDYKKALLYHKKFHDLKDSIFNEKNVKKITRLEMQYRFDKENELRKLKAANIEHQNKMIINMLILGILSLVLISALLYRLYYLRKKSNEQLKEKNAKISETLAINQTLFKETHHRVKNNLQIISSLLNMQSKFLDDAKSKNIVLDSRNRIQSMSLIHQKLYQENRVTGIETRAYFSELLKSLMLTYAIADDKVESEIENVILDVDTAIPLGLMLNELITNAFKYGVVPRNGSFYFHFSKHGEDYLLIKLADNGEGLPEGFDQNKNNSFGMKLIHSLGKKLKADIFFENKGGLHITIKIHKFMLSK